MSDSANFASIPRSESATISAANTNRDGTGTITSLFTSGASGSRVERIEIHANGTTIAGLVRAFKKNGAGAWKLWREYAVSAITPSASTPAFYALDDEVGEILAAGWQVGFSTHNAEGFEVFVSGGDF